MGMPYALGRDAIVGVEIGVVWVSSVVGKRPSDQMTLLGMVEKGGENDEAWADERMNEWRDGMAAHRVSVLRELDRRRGRDLAAVLGP